MCIRDRFTEVFIEKGMIVKAQRECYFFYLHQLPYQHRPAGMLVQRVGDVRARVQCVDRTAGRKTNPSGNTGKDEVPHCA